MVARTSFSQEGHAKAIHANFDLARQQNGLCFLRFDDTNPESEKRKYMDSILEDVVWLTGGVPKKITYSSDYFQQLYDLALVLIRKGRAYVCHQTREQIKESRKKRELSPWRDRSVKENVDLFNAMRQGKFAENAATLRLKSNYDSDNPQMWDIVAYRIKYVSHPQVGSKWCIYPSYDYSHCIIDSLCEWKL